MRALACPASLKGVLDASSAAAALAAGLRAGGAETVELPVADGGDGTLDAIQRSVGGDWHRADVPDAFGRAHTARWLELADGTAVVEAAEAIPLDPARLDPMRASSRGLGELIAATGSPERLLDAPCELLDLPLRGVEPLAAEPVQLLASFPERDRIVERDVATF